MASVSHKEYNRKWRLEHKEELREYERKRRRSPSRKEYMHNYQQKWHSEHKEEVARKARVWRVAHKKELQKQRKVKYKINKEKERAQQAVYYKNNRKRLIQQTKEYQDSHREQRREWCQQYYLDNRKRLLEEARLYRLTHKEQKAARDKIYAAAHRQQINAYSRRWVKKHPEQRQAISASVKARRAKAPGNGWKSSDFKVKLRAQRARCYYCNKKMKRGCDVYAVDYPTIDHVIPLNKGGKHDLSNIVIACRECNSHKHQSMPSSFAGMLNL